MNDNLRLREEDRHTMHLKVARVLRESIVRGDFKEGERLVQSDIAEQLGVSRMPIREALRQLASEGLVILEPHRGAIVKPLTTNDVREIYELRAQLEKKAVELSVQNFTDHDIDVLEAYVLKMDEEPNIDEFMEINMAFHRQLISCCPWQRLLYFIETLWHGFPQESPHFLSGQKDISNDEHKEILTAVKNKDSKLAAEITERHINRTGQNLIRNLEEMNRLS